MQLKLRFLASLALLIIVAACQSSPRTEYAIEITREVTVVVIVTATSDDIPAITDATSTQSNPTPTATTVIVEPPTATLNPQPTPLSQQVIVAEQLFEGGRMLYLQPAAQIWVLYGNDVTVGGSWQRFPDNWVEGMPETDPDFAAPDGFYQPERGFGKLWRENEQVRQGLGWALEPEVGHVTTYQYVQDSRVENNQTVFFELHTVNSYYDNNTLVFYEADNMWGVLATPLGQ